MIRTQEEVDQEKEDSFKRMIIELGGNIILEKPITFRLTPHSNTLKITKLSINDNFSEYKEARDTVLQVLRGLTYNKNK